MFLFGIVGITGTLGALHGGIYGTNRGAGSAVHRGTLVADGRDGAVLVEPHRSANPADGAAAVWAYFGHFDRRVAGAPATDEAPTEDIGTALAIEPRTETGGGDLGEGRGDPSVVAAFSAGYLAAGWRPDLLAHFLLVVGGPTAACETGESGWRIDPEGFHLGLAQFNPDSWSRAASITGYYDWRDPWQHGFNVAIWASMTDYETQWSCW